MLNHKYTLYLLAIYLFVRRTRNYVVSKSKYRFIAPNY